MSDNVKKPTLVGKLRDQVRDWLGDWRIVLLGLTGLALSLASAYTTWDGMSQFTSSDVLSGLITFGIQGIMLICAFILGQQLIRRTYLSLLPTLVMFLICMGSSVFFSFDSLFRQVLPPAERKATAAIRMQSEVPDLISDLAKATTRERASAASALLNSPEWNAYEASLQTLVNLSENAKTDIQQQELKKLARIQSQRGKNEARMRTAQTRVAELDARIKENEARRNAIKAELPALRQEQNRITAAIRAKEQEIIKQDALAEAEATGVGGTLKRGRGPKYRALKLEVDRLKLEKATLEKELQIAAQARARKEQEMNGLLTAQEEIVQQRSRFATDMKTAKQGLSFSDASVDTDGLNTFEGAAAVLPRLRDTFRNTPTRENFAKLQSNCQVLLGGLANQPAYAPKLSRISCEPKEAIGLTQDLFALNSGQTALAAECGPLPKTAKLDADQLITRGQTCLDKSGLTGEAARPFRNRLKTLKLERDDQASSFVVTINAFKDRNWLAYLALGIAIAIDMLVLFSGIFSARVAEENERRIGREHIDLNDQETKAKLASLKAVLFDNTNLYTPRQLAEQFHASLIPDDAQPNMSYRIEEKQVTNEDGTALNKRLIGVATTLGLAKTSRGKYWVSGRFIELIDRMLEQEPARAKVHDMPAGNFRPSEPETSTAFPKTVEPNFKVVEQKAS